MTCTQAPGPKRPADGRIALTATNEDEICLGGREEALPVFHAVSDGRLVLRPIGCMNGGTQQYWPVQDESIVW